MTQLIAFLHCPVCKQATPEQMPLDHCLHAYECPSCHAVIRAKRGHCCVFCSYADLPCPPCQVQNTCEVPFSR